MEREKRVLLCGCFYIQGEHRRTDWFVKRLYTPKGWFTLPFEGLDSPERLLAEMYAEVRSETVGSMACIACKKVCK